MIQMTAPDRLHTALAQQDEPKGGGNLPPPLQAEPVQEPVAWRYKGMMGMPWSLSDDGYYVSCKRDNGYMVEPLYTQPPRREPEQEQAEPVLVVEKEPDYMSRVHFYEGSKPFIDPTEVWKLPIGTKLYTAPPRREWQGLSEEDMEDLLPLYSDPNTDAEMLEFAIAIEAALKEKNHG
jgi:hypothetical protein